MKKCPSRSVKLYFFLFCCQVIETNNHGKLLSFNPVTKETKVLLNNLYLANGVAVSACGTFLLVVEMSVCQIRK